MLYEAITLKPPFRAEDMQGLYKRVLAGKYARIPSKHYSEDLARTLAELLKVDAQQRPSCAEILEMRAVR